uniref:Putative secreted protein n=1 Tax=Anopheles darlingi TaxID=43151 RepID=A0A2M4DAB4_ANODA
MLSLFFSLSIALVLVVVRSYAIVLCQCSGKSNRRDPARPAQASIGGTDTLSQDGEPAHQTHREHSAR